MDLGAPRCSCLQDASVTPVLPIEDIEVRAPVDIEKPGFVSLEDLYGALPVFVYPLVGCSLLLLVRRMNHPDGLQKNLFRFCFRRN